MSLNIKQFPKPGSDEFLVVFNEPTRNGAIPWAILPKVSAPASKTSKLTQFDRYKAKVADPNSIISHVLDTAGYEAALKAQSPKPHVLSEKTEDDKKADQK